jgi:transcriptional regulator with XRE-family HTH domain
MPPKSTLDRKRATAMRIRRIELGLTQQDLADRTGWSQELISQMERGLSPGSADSRRALAKALRSSIRELWPDAA